MFKEYIEERYDQRMDKLVEKSFMHQSDFAFGLFPLQEVDVSQVVPSEIDDYYRHSEIQGFVHDMGAACKMVLAVMLGCLAMPMMLPK